MSASRSLVATPTHAVLVGHRIRRLADSARSHFRPRTVDQHDQRIRLHLVSTGIVRCSITVVIADSVNPMGGPVKRPYRSPLREQAALRTRTQIRDAAARLFVRQGYVATTMRQISEEAQVSERTTYLVFPSKLELLLEVIGVATAGDDRPVPIAERPEFQAALSEHDGERALELGVSWISKLLERAGALVMAAYESAGADEALREAAMHGERARAQDLSLIAEALQAHGALRPGLSAEEATDILLVLISPQAHQMLRRDRRRSMARYQSTVLKVLKLALLRE
jgi:AcrR family transcriptional regulator